MSRAVHFGELLSFGQSSSRQLNAWLAAHDEAFARELGRQADMRGETLAQFVRIAVSDFLAEADEAAWADLISTVRDAGDPGAACVAKITAFRRQMEGPA